MMQNTKERQLDKIKILEDLSLENRTVDYETEHIYRQLG